MKRSKKLCILLGILIAVCLAALAAMYAEEKKEEIKTSGETVLSVESTKVTALCWEQDGTTWSFHRGDDGWQKLTTILIVDDIIPSIRTALRSRFSRAKNTARGRSAIRSQVIVELEKKVAAEIIDSYGEVTVTASEDDPTVCLVEFSFAVAHGLNQIYLTVHITV